MIDRLFGREQFDRLFDELRVDPADGLPLLGHHRVNRCPDLCFDHINRRADLPHLGDGIRSGPRIPSCGVDALANSREIALEDIGLLLDSGIARDCRQSWNDKPNRSLLSERPPTLRRTIRKGAVTY